MDLAAKFPETLPEFQRMFPDDGACARYLESVRFTALPVRVDGTCQHFLPLREGDVLTGEAPGSA